MDAMDTRLLLPDRILSRFPEGRMRTFDIGPGWYPLVIQLDADIAALLPDYIILQCKEKFGGLRYYVQLPGASDKVARMVRELIMAAQMRATTICEVCGEPGQEREKTSGWDVVRCDAHAPS